MPHTATLQPCKPARPGTDPATPDSGLLARLRAALAPDTMAALFAASRWGPISDGARVVECEVTRVFPRGAKGFVIVYLLRLERAGQDAFETVFGELVPGNAVAHRLDVLRRLGGVDGDAKYLFPAAGSIGYLPGPGLVLRRPGYDEALAGLRLLQRPEEVAAIAVEGGIPVPDTGYEASAELLGHRLGKRAVMRLAWAAGQRGCETPAPSSVIAKVYSGKSHRARNSQDVMRALWRDGLDGSDGVRVPRTLGNAADEAALFLEDIPGTPLPRLTEADVPAGMAAAGRALSRLNLCRVDGLKGHGIEDEIHLLEGWVDLIGRVRPELRSTIEPALAAVRAELSRVGAGPVAAIHRDYHPKQIFLDGDTTILIDFDTLCAGDPALDVGNFLAHLRLAGLRSGQDMKANAEAFLSGFGTALNGGFAVRIVAYEKSALLRVACLYSLSTRWAHLARPLLRGVA